MVAIVDRGGRHQWRPLTGAIHEAAIEEGERASLRMQDRDLPHGVSLCQQVSGRCRDREAQSGLNELREITGELWRRNDEVADRVQVVAIERAVAYGCRAALIPFVD